MDFYHLSDRIGQVLQLIAVIWNALLLIVLCRLKSPRRSYFTLVRSLTVADLLLPFLLFMFALYYQNDIINSRGDVVDIMIMVNRYSCRVILIHLICLAAEHFVAIIKPLCYDEWCRCRYIICRLVFSWTFPLLFTLLEETVTNDKVMLILPGLIVLSFLIMLVVYILIFCEVRKQQRFENSQNSHARKNYRALVTTILNVVTFFLCWMPVTLTEILSALDTDILGNPYIFFFFYTGVNFICANSICDALIYSIRLTEVQKFWRKTFCCVGPCAHSPDNQ